MVCEVAGWFVFGTTSFENEFDDTDLLRQSV